jgi:signal transduction histidine kinase
VTDAGCGIATDHQVIIFNPFTRLHGSSMTASDGIGIGLAVSKKLAEQLGGTIGVDSQVGAGSTFWVDFPCRKCAVDCHALPRTETA